MKIFDRIFGPENKKGSEDNKNEKRSPLNAGAAIDYIAGLAGRGGTQKVEELKKIASEVDPALIQAESIASQTADQIEQLTQQAKGKVAETKKPVPAAGNHPAKKFIPATRFRPADQVLSPQKKKERELLPSEKKKIQEAERLAAEANAAVKQERRLPEAIENLESYNKQTAIKLRLEGVPVNDDCRIDEARYSEVYTEKELADDEIRSAKKREDNEKKEARLAAEWPGRAEQAKMGPVMEKFAVALFNKLFGDQFIICQSAVYDDYFGGIDMVIVDKTTGAVIGAFDAVTWEQAQGVSKRAKDKHSKEIIENCQEGGKLRYGLGLSGKQTETSGKDGKVVLMPRNNVPVLYLGLSTPKLKKALLSIDFSKKDISKFEFELMEEFLASLGEQIESIDFFKGQGENSDLKQTISKLGGAFERKQLEM